MLRFFDPLRFEVIAEREFHSDIGEVFTLKIGKPYQEESSYCCPWEITGPKFSKKMASYGADSMQALVLAQNMIHVYITTSPNLTLTWHGKRDLSIIAQNLMEEKSY